ncbi:MAG: ferritin [Eubacteriales bacterium]|nr:ferritin [Eubacteriales bacterium]
MDKKLLEMTQNQIQMEYFSGYLYLSMADWLERQDLPGAANWMYIQYQEEVLHAQGFIKFLQRLGQPIALRQIDQPQREFESLEEVFQMALDHEKEVSESIRNMAKRANEADEFEMREFLNWYIMEQVEEEENAEENLANVQLIGNNPAGLYSLDKSWAARSFEAEDIPYIEG